MKKYKLYIGGEFVESSSGHYIGVENPATGKIFAEVSDGNSEDVNNAVMAAKYSLQGTTQGNGLTGGVPPVRFSM